MSKKHISATKCQKSKFYIGKQESGGKANFDIENIKSQILQIFHDGVENFSRTNSVACRAGAVT